mmetsp:Transcript_739/g.1495  ORF Transcript_739/g.1495 Transcript_739/m.1495 type:complete len:190 (-) Transcript_739:100-669(-)|eukprot:CAMPEP_0183304842 /NCGR_PEP_ID=MMETSP0160_2-20130417/9791_1 /TAXON_ID=2839 ORGANISM="Odontella Sinensis, Strain Grunow 1884" /NCGR_SAMPLE_ID=MMETSP0160_2 /ASSEMBLY_ACC=CAM_ASM_000250 /LENGTH=189 /DNA_ID=CAMNT_0025467961 /DNA_START=245 /DNA_END=814 /DNA_ORIENTATION=+
MRPIARVHYLKLHESPVVDGNYDRFGLLWLIDPGSGDAHPARSTSQGTDSSSSAWEGLDEGDLLIFPELLSGAGEFEAMRFVGEKTEEGMWPILTGGVDIPEIPQVIVSLLERKGLSWRAFYERPFETILKDQGFCMSDVFGDDEEALVGFWSAPVVARRKGPPKSENWVIPLEHCTWMKSLIFEENAN